MADLPILFSGSMVRAILREIEKPGTGKTQTRRVIEPYTAAPFPGSKPSVDAVNIIVTKVPARLGGWMEGPSFKPRIKPGDRLYVREHWRASKKWDGTPPRDLPPRTMSIFFEAGGSIANYSAVSEDGSGEWLPSEWPSDGMPPWVGKHRQAMHMPKWASRITLSVLSVKIERLQDISGADAIAEGAEITTERTMTGPMVKVAAGTYLSPVAWYHRLWDEINGPGAWDANPWVVAYSFRPQLGNIDQIGGGA